MFQSNQRGVVQWEGPKESWNLNVHVDNRVEGIGNSLKQEFNSIFSIMLGSGNFFFFAMNIGLKSHSKSFAFTNLQGALKVYQSAKKYSKATKGT